MTASHREPSIKRGVSLYSFQEEFFLRRMTLEDCVAACADMGAYGIETLAEQMMPGFPHLSDAFYEDWHALMAKYGTVSVCHDMFLDTKRFKGRAMTDDEQVESVKRDLTHARRLGCSVMRVLMFVRPEVLVKALPYAEECGVKMGVEIHAPLHLSHPWILRYSEVMDKEASPYLGYVLDMGIFTDHYPPVMLERFRRQGATPAIIDHVRAEYDRRTLSEYVINDVREMGGTPLDIAMAEVTRHNLWSDPRHLIEQLPRIVHVHGKFYEMDEQDRETSLGYEQVIPVLREHGYDGYICSEYEGNRHIQDAFEVGSVEQVRRHQRMLARLIGEPEVAHV
ncbi:sugar phosphate isomerase/epimerase [Deinococcus metalli]|uniref:Sugar phosphate isomerase/epimerase n=1 Tax=Deinococcus metalli TaxID=1141878 RepID=A0A7W8KGV1_9DEIO|nr:TIM barrel protein [Deinococcus metalli]MBB5376771.1 sugar phosphate isomerase/epimerase [Deinococcus metalli]GHF45230.1 xylose isomerase [Deinococcus metalli]